MWNYDNENNILTYRRNVPSKGGWNPIQFWILLHWSGRKDYTNQTTLVFKSKKYHFAYNIFQAPTTTSQNPLYFAYNKSSIDAKNPSQQTFVHLQMLKQYHHWHTSHKHTMKFQLTIKKSLQRSPP